MVSEAERIRREKEEELKELAQKAKNDLERAENLHKLKLQDSIEDHQKKVREMDKQKVSLLQQKELECRNKVKEMYDKLQESYNALQAAELSHKETLDSIQNERNHQEKLRVEEYTRKTTELKDRFNEKESELKEKIRTMEESYTQTISQQESLLSKKLQVLETRSIYRLNM